MIGRAVVNLSAAIAANSPTRIETPSAQWVRFHKSDSLSYVRLRSKNAPTIEVVAPFTVRSCGNMIDAIYVDNAGVAGTGELVVLYGDGDEELEDFLAGESSAPWQADSIIDTEASTAVVDRIASANPATLQGNGFIDNARQIWGLRVWRSTGGTAYIRSGYSSSLLSLLAPVGTTRRMTGLQERLVAQCMGLRTGAAGTKFGIFGFYGDGGGNPFGVGFAFSDANPNWRAVFTDDDMTYAQFPHTTPIINVDTGVPISELAKLEMRWGDNGTSPFFEWWVNGLRIHRVMSWPTWPTWPNPPYRSIHVVQNGVGDTIEILTGSPIVHEVRRV